MNQQLQAEQPPACATFRQAGVTPCESSLSDGVGQPLSDQGREEAIRRAGRALQLHMAAHESLSAVHAATSCFADQGEADRQLRMAHEAKRLMVALIQGRSRDQVRRLEIKAGLI